MQKDFAFRVRLGEYELEVRGDREDVLKTIGELPSLMTNIHMAFESVKPKTIARLTVKTEPAKEEARAQDYPKISPTEDCELAITRALETDWGKWRPRTINELKEALVANGLDYSGRTLVGVLNGLVKRGTVRRWNTDAGFVYILVGKEAVDSRGEVR